jgi:pimeloyl-ACP methyl ester carboxylesterase
MKWRAFAVLLCMVVAMECHGQPSLPSNFQAKTIHSPAGADIFVRWAGTGPVVLLIHGYAENSDSWAPLAEDLMMDHTVIVPDLRGIGRSSKPEGGYDKKTQAEDMRAVVTTLGYDKTFVVAHDIGNMVAYAYAATYPTKVERLVVMDAPIPGIEPWNEILLTPGVWHFNFHGPDAERLVAGRERIYIRPHMERLHRRSWEAGRSNQKFLYRDVRAARGYAGWICTIYRVCPRCKG